MALFRPAFLDRHHPIKLHQAGLTLKSRWSQKIPPFLVFDVFASAVVASKSSRWCQFLDPATLALQRTLPCFELIESDPVLGFDLPPKPSMLAGQVLKHCYSTVDRILAKRKPCIFKIGYTHCASFRWHNDVFGYKYERDKWEGLIVVYAASETISPAFVEGALIQRHKGFWTYAQV